MSIRHRLLIALSICACVPASRVFAQNPQGSAGQPMTSAPSGSAQGTAPPSATETAPARAEAAVRPVDSESPLPVWAQVAAVQAALTQGATAQAASTPLASTAAPAQGGAATSAQQSAYEEDARPNPTEPDYRVVNLPTTLPVPEHKGVFALTHRFNGDLTQGTFLDQLKTLFGMDEGAFIGLEYRYGVMRNLEAVVLRTSPDQVFQFTGKWDGWRQKASTPMVVSVSPFVAVEGMSNFSENYTTSIGAVVSRSFDTRLEVHAEPWLSANSAAGTGVYRNTFVLGLGARARVQSHLYLVGELSPRLAGYDVDQTAYGFGFEARVGGHVFQINFNNSQAATFGQIARGGFPNKLYFGFNLSRKFF